MNGGRLTSPDLSDRAADDWSELLERAASEGDESGRRMAVIDGGACLTSFLEGQGIEVAGQLADALGSAAEMGLIDDECRLAARRAVRLRNRVAHEMAYVSAEQAVTCITAMHAVCVTPVVAEAFEVVAETLETGHRDARGSGLAGRVVKGLAIGAAALAVIGLLTSAANEQEQKRKRGGNTDR